MTGLLCHLSQANRIANGDPDIIQNILACNFQNYIGALAKGKKLSIGEQVNFMKHREGEFRSGYRRDFGHGGYHASNDVFNKQLYHSGEVEIFHIQYSDEAGHEEDISNGKGEITPFTSINRLLQNYNFSVISNRTKLSEKSIYLIKSIC